MLGAYPLVYNIVLAYEATLWPKAIQSYPENDLPSSWDLIRVKITQIQLSWFYNKLYPKTELIKKIFGNFSRFFRDFLGGKAS